MKLKVLDKCIYKYPNEWRLQKISEGVNIQSGYAFKKSDFQDYGVPVIKIKNIEPPNITLNDVQYVSDCLADEKKLFQLNYNDILISLTGSNVNQFSSAVGKVGRVKIKNKKMVLNQRVGRFLLKDTSILDYDYLYHYISTESVQYELASAAAGSANQANISPSQILSLTMPYPPLPEQRAIAEILSSIDDKIELNNQMNRTLEAMAQAIFKQWFVDFKFPQNSKASDSQNPLLRREGGPLAVGDALSLPKCEVKMIDSELGPIPEGWRVGVFNDLVEDIIDNRGKTPPLEQEGIIMIEGNSIINDYSFPVFSNTAKLKYVSEYTYNNWFRDGHPEYLDILCATVGSLPKWCFMPKNKKICIAQNIVAIRSKNNSSPFYLKCFMNSEYFIESFNGRIVTTAQPSIKIGHLTSIPIIVPSDFIMKSFGELVKPLYELIENKIEENQTLSALRDSLLPKLMSGELRVPEEIVKRYEETVSEA